VRAFLRWKGLCALLSLGAVLAAGAAGAGVAAPSANHHTFTDPLGDNVGNSSDIGTVDVANDDAGTLVFRVTLPNRDVLLEHDSIGVYLDVDAKPTTDKCLGLDYALQAIGHAPTRDPVFFLLQCAAGETFIPALPQKTFTGSFDGATHELVLSVNRREIGFPKRVQIAVAATAAEGEFDTAGSALLPWFYDILTPRDRTPPHVRAAASRGLRGTRVRLSYGVSDDSGRTREEITVLKGKKTIYRHRTKLQPSEPNVPYGVVWQAPRSVFGKLRFCVRAWDEAGNRAGPSCASLTIR
jgi:hypothetical protein